MAKLTATVHLNDRHAEAKWTHENAFLLFCLLTGLNPEMLRAITRRWKGGNDA